MFITLTIDTHKVKKSAVKMQKKIFVPGTGGSWRNGLHAKKRGFFDKMFALKRVRGNYALSGQGVLV
ncbi:hypothetical protein COY05_01295 [Candidatus Peregrinibacteria bacterium CG_4_10_14_0_2_um_filter_38_24]|nr:MAG: hypothetical protein COY05_01295 [Candidatus Peregrinibacteria bacterium CG_4_10_14_0_2_um_filter_38_24]PJC39213.1 MAG: hypothetical protein CO044_00995 [Candidatus Peregrinibacteria bacterium CG_4_9_14_0_2_um_filter_38_9]